VKLQTKQGFSYRDDHQRPAHHLPAGTEVLDVGFDHVQQQRSVEWKIEFLQVNELHTSYITHSCKYLYQRSFSSILTNGKQIN